MRRLRAAGKGSKMGNYITFNSSRGIPYVLQMLSHWGLGLALVLVIGAWRGVSHNDFTLPKACVPRHFYRG